MKPNIPSHLSPEVLESIKILFMAPDTLALYGIPYLMREDVGQEPRHLWEAGNTKGWVYLGYPGWFYGSTEDHALAEAFKAKHKNILPQNPYEWVILS